MHWIYRQSGVRYRFAAGNFACALARRDPQRIAWFALGTARLLTALGACSYAGVVGLLLSVSGLLGELAAGAVLDSRLIARCLVISYCWLNATHQGLCYFGHLAGYRAVHDVA